VHLVQQKKYTIPENGDNHNIKEEEEEEEKTFTKPLNYHMI
jgi:hypothetical protein